MAASSQSLDFGGLFLALSFFLMGAALLLIALLFALGIENRAREIGTLLSLGFTPKRVRRMLLVEGALLSGGRTARRGAGRAIRASRAGEH